MAKMFYTIGEVSEMLGENASAIRYWSNHFEKFIKPERNAKGNRRFTEDDIAYLRQIQFLMRHAVIGRHGPGGFELSIVFLSVVDGQGEDILRAGFFYCQSQTGGGVHAAAG